MSLATLPKADTHVHAESLARLGQLVARRRGLAGNDPRPAIATDDPLRVDTTIGREYEVAAGLGFSTAELLGFTRNGVQASFTRPERKQALLDAVDAFEAGQEAPAFTTERR